MINFSFELFNRPLLIDHDWLMSALVGMGARVSAEGHIYIDRFGVFDDRDQKIMTRYKLQPYQTRDNVAVIPIEGPLDHKGGIFSGWSTNYQEIMTRVAHAKASPDVKGVVFEVDSPGGVASGAKEAADAINDLSLKKPTMSILTNVAFSSGYYLASAARQVVVPTAGYSGSIGAAVMHVDISKALEKNGVNVTLLSSGKYKTEGSPFVPLSQAANDRATARLDGLRQQFAKDVSTYRAGRLTYDQAMDTEANTFDANDSVKYGLVDAIGNPHAAFDAFVNSVNTNRGFMR